MAQPGILLLLACAICPPCAIAYRAEVNIFAPTDKLPSGVPPQTRPIPAVFGGRGLTGRDQLRYLQIAKEQQKAEEMRRLGVDEYRSDDKYRLKSSDSSWYLPWGSIVLRLMTIEYLGDRNSMDAEAHDFDVKTPDKPDGAFSVRFRRTKVDGIGFGSHFYQKFAILPFGATDVKKDALYTIRMYTPHFSTGAKEWAVYKGYCKEYLGGLGMWCNEASQKARQSLPWRHIFCTPQEFEDKPSWAAKEPYSCSVNQYGTKDKYGNRNKDFTALSFDFFDKSLDKPEDMRMVRSNPKAWTGDDKLQGGGASDGEAFLMMMIGTALKEAFTMGGSGN